MAFSLEEVVPWGRSFAEYLRMFELTEADLAKRILGCGDGPASFNRTLTMRGGSVTSVDPIYRFTTEEISARINETYQSVMEQTRLNAQEFVWKEIASVEELGEVRWRAMQEFLRDYLRGKTGGRYVAAELPELPFPGGHFDLALCSHFLFLYSQQFDADFHLRSLRELSRVAGEVRVFPILELGAVRSRHVDEVASALAAERYEVEIRKVPYQFQKGGDEMLVVRRVSSRRQPLS